MVVAVVAAAAVATLHFAVQAELVAVDKVDIQPVLLLELLTQVAAAAVQPVQVNQAVLV
jgi:hypothetical protein